MSQTKGFNLEGFKREFESEAKLRCGQQEIKIKELHQKVADQVEELRAMRNRCYALTLGSVCKNCGYQHNCANATSEQA